MILTFPLMDSEDILIRNLKTVTKSVSQSVNVDLRDASSSKNSALSKLIQIKHVYVIKFPNYSVSSKSNLSSFLSTALPEAHLQI